MVYNISQCVKLNEQQNNCVPSRKKSLRVIIKKGLKTRNNSGKSQSKLAKSVY